MSHIASSSTTASCEVPKQQWRALALPGLLVLVAFALAMQGTFLTLIDLWSNSAGYGHGFLVLAVCLYLIYLRREEIAFTSARSSVIGLLITCALIGVWFASRILSVLIGEQVTFVLALLSLILTLYGGRVAKIVSLPILYLFCAVPLWSYLTPLLQDSTAQMATRMSRALGVPLYLEEVYMTIPDGVFLVATMCAGISYLLASLSLGAFYALLNLQLAWTRVVLVLLAIAAGVVFNWIRVTAIVLIGHHSQMQHPVVAKHEMFGWLLFILVVFFVMFCGRVLERIEERSSVEARADAVAREASRPMADASKTWVMAILCVLALSLPAYASLQLFEPPANASQINLSAARLGEASGWNSAAAGATDGWAASIQGADSEAAASYTNGERKIDLQIGYFVVQRSDSEAVNERHHYYDSKAWRRAFEKVATDRVAIVSGFEVNEFSLQHMETGGRRLVWWWYWVDEEFTASRVQAKVLQIRSILSGNRSAAIVVMSSVVVGTVEQTRNEMKGWLRESAADLAANLKKTPG